MAEKESLDTQIKLIAQDVGNIKTSVKEIKDDVKQIKLDNEKEYTSKQEFQGHEYRLSRLEKVVYSGLSLVLLGFGGAVVSYFIRSPRQ